MRVIYDGDFTKYQQWRVIDANLQAAIISLGRGSGPLRDRMNKVLEEGLRQASPKLTGKLSRRWVVAILANGTIRLRNRQDYAHYQDTETRNRGYIRRGVQNAVRILRKLVATGQFAGTAPSRQAIGDYKGYSFAGQFAEVGLRGMQRGPAKFERGYKKRPSRRI